MQTRVLAIDFGGSSGRAVMGTYNGKSIEMQELHRFSNDPVYLNDKFYWDFLRLFHEVKQSLLKAKQVDDFQSIGIDTWGVDFGLLDEKGNLLDNPLHYRDSGSIDMVEKIYEKIPPHLLYEITGLQTMNINSLFQLYGILENRPHLWKMVDKILFMPDLFNYFLTGEKKSEYTITSTSQLLNLNAKKISSEIQEKIFSGKDFLCDIVEPGNVVGQLSPNIQKELGINPVDVINVASHDTQSAMVAVPNREKDYLFLSCGTWSLLGTQVDKAINNIEAFNIDITNEGYLNGETSLLKNIIGLWLVQESRRQWIREGKDYSFATLDEMALEAGQIDAYIDPDDPSFITPGDMPNKVREYLARTNQYVPKNEGEIVRVIYQSLATKYAQVINDIENLLKKKYQKFYVIGGGVQSKLFCQIIADYTKREVVAGPVEATVLGNIVIQLMTLGKIESLEEAKHIIRRTYNIKSYFPV